MYILLTCCGGFIGFHLTLKLLKENKKIKIIGIDNLNSYYDPNLKQSRLKGIQALADVSSGRWKFYKTSLENDAELKDIFRNKIESEL